MYDTIAKFYKIYPIKVKNAFLQYVWDVNNVKYIDCDTCHGAVFLGHRNPKIVKAIQNQLNKILSISMNYIVDVREEFDKKIKQVLPIQYGKIILQNSGTEAVEVALKIAKKLTKRKYIVAFTNSFHGRTMGSLSVTWNKRYRNSFEPLYPYVKFAPFNAYWQVEKFVDENTCCVIVEPIQGEGGINVATREFLKTLREVTSKVGALLIFDEIQCGFGRTGSIWAFEEYGIYPDIFTAGKAIAGGLPIGLTIIKKEFGDVFDQGEHGSTFAGNPLILAATIAGIDLLIEDNILEKVKIASNYFFKRLTELKNEKIVRIKGKGLMIGIEIKDRVEKYIEKLIIGKKVLALTANINVLRLLPPYTITIEDIDYIVESVDYVLRGN